MNRFITILFCFTCLCASVPAHAQQREYKSGLNYTALSKKPKPAQSASTIDTKAQNAEAPEPSEVITASPEESSDPTTRIWNKYKELATGTTEEQKAKVEKKEKDKTVEPDKPDPPEKPKTNNVNQTQDSPRQNNAFGTILENWKQSKENRRDMRSMSFRNPDLPTKPSAEEPETP